LELIEQDKHQGAGNTSYHVRQVAFKECSRAFFSGNLPGVRVGYLKQSIVFL
jgi:hypothetical protein